MCPPPPQHRLLILDHDKEFREILPVELRSAGVDAVAETVATFSEAIQRLHRKGYDAVLFRLNSPGQVSFLLRLKTAAPRTPVLAIAPESSRDLGRLLQESGVDVFHATRDHRRAARLVARALVQRALIRHSRVVVHESRRLRADLQEVRERRAALTSWAFDLSDIPAANLSPLLVEEDPDQALLVRRSFAKLDLPFLLPVLRDGEEALAYLSGAREFADRSRHPLPTLLLLDVHLPGKSGFEILSDVRSQPSLEDLPVFMMTSSSDPGDRERALLLGADSYFHKPFSPGELLELVKIIAVRWSLLYRAVHRAP